MSMPKDFNEKIRLEEQGISWLNVCSQCGHRWTAKVAKPKRCPKCNATMDRKMTWENDHFSYYSLCCPLCASDVIVNGHLEARDHVVKMTSDPRQIKIQCYSIYPDSAPENIRIVIEDYTE